MEKEEREQRELDIFVLLDDFLRQAKRMWLLGLVLILVFSAGLVFLQRRSYKPEYEAYASFTVRVANPLYAGVSGYNDKTAEVMENTFPSILTSSLLRQKVMSKLGISSVPSIRVSATAQASILTLTVRDSDPQRAYDVLNAVIEYYPEVAEFVVGSTTLVLLDESGVPTGPVSSFNSRPHMLRGALIGGGIWCVLVLLLIMVKNTVHNEGELRRTLNTPCLGQVPSVKVTRKIPYPLVYKLDNRSGFAESVRLLRLRVEKTMEAEQKKVLLVSSAIPGEGKTTIAANLAISLAQKDKQVLLIDCDLRNPSVASTLSTGEFPLTTEKSLVDFLEERVKVLEIIQQTQVENLFVISGGSGGKAEYVSLLSQDRMDRLIQAARSTYDYVILDTPPCSLLSDAAEVAELAECGLMVIRQDFATREQILDGVQRLADSKLPIIGCAFNNVRRSASSGYGYGYGGYGGYGYGSYGEEKKKMNSKASGKGEA